MRMDDEILLICAGGFSACELFALRDAARAEGKKLAEFDAAALHRWAGDVLGPRGRRARRNAHWPRRISIESMARRLEAMGARVVWADDPLFPSSAVEALDSAERPAWMIVAGDPARLARPQIAVIGSRETPPDYLAAAGRLARALSDSGFAVTSGMARGADSAAHEGAAAGAGGTIGVPAMGIQAAARSLAPSVLARATLVGIAPPRASFNTGFAIRRNHLIAAMGEALVLVASGIHGGSAYALRWALAHGRPVFCFEGGPTPPPANAALIRARAAVALRLADSAETWVEIMRAQLTQGSKRRRSRRAVTQPSLVI
jgi:predicted Rossmann fold nucleotide-binding protein DprA/Smf involved in DNA uptake